MGLNLPEERTTSKTRITATIQITSSKDLASAIYRALLPEASQEHRRRASINMEYRGRCLIVEIDSRDLSSARAVIGSYLRLIKAAASAVEKVKK